MKTFLIGLLTVVAANMVMAQGKFIKQGHRGCRGLMPENTIAAMKKALDLGVEVLELDVVISKDKQAVVSHDAYMSSENTLQPSGLPILEKEEKTFVLYEMPYSQIKKFDVGSKPNPQFPEQKHFKTYKPLLSELITAADNYAREKGLPPPSYNIEIKSEPSTDNRYHPKPEEFVALVIGVCNKGNILDRMSIQSFDVRPLQLIRRLYPSIQLSYLTANEESIDQNLNALGFTPDLYSPYYKTVNAEAVKFCHEKNMKIIPWTVNTKEEIKALMKLGVDGLITDYPNLF